MLFHSHNLNVQDSQLSRSFLRRCIRRHAPADEHGRNDGQFHRHRPGARYRIVNQPRRVDHLHALQAAGIGNLEGRRTERSVAAGRHGFRVCGNLFPACPRSQRAASMCFSSGRRLRPESPTSSASVRDCLTSPSRRMAPSGEPPRRRRDDARRHRPRGTRSAGHDDSHRHESSSASAGSSQERNSETFGPATQNRRMHCHRGGLRHSGARLLPLHPLSGRRQCSREIRPDSAAEQDCHVFRFRERTHHLLADRHVQLRRSARSSRRRRYGTAWRRRRSA